MSGSLPSSTASPSFAPLAFWRLSNIDHTSCQEPRVAPFEYSAMFWAVLYGLLLFADVPTLTTWIGSAIVIGAGLFMLAVDRRRRGPG